MMVATTSIGASSNDSNYECEKLAMDVHETLLKQGASHSSAYWWSEMIYDACEYTGPQMWEN
ncbi:MAG: hypothetical protein OIF50_01875 [Flavobacteriaceae bacterium]|nr:hypothetical protein [Flavobacteriaceae bacterium]